MLEHLIAFMTEPDQHACAWRDGELYIEPLQSPAQDVAVSTSARARGEEKIAA
jgi:hypothetical protein